MQNIFTKVGQYKSTSAIVGGTALIATMGYSYYQGYWKQSNLPKVELKITTPHQKSGNPKNLYLSFDIEADGPAPSINNMLSIGIYGFNGEGKEVVSYQRNIKECDNRKIDIPTKERFWDKNPEIWKFVHTNAVSAKECMNEIGDLYQQHKDAGYKITWVARPAAYDWQWVNSYYNEFADEGKPNIGFSCSCISTAFYLYCQQKNLSKAETKELWNKLKGDEEVTHNPLDDARCQAKVLMGLMDLYQIPL